MEGELFITKNDAVFNSVVCSILKLTRKNEPTEESDELIEKSHSIFIN